MKSVGLMLVVGRVLVALAVLLILLIGGFIWWRQGIIPWSNQADNISFSGNGSNETVVPLAADEADVAISFNEVAAKAIEISTFEDQPGSGWQGGGLYDSGNAYEGQQSLQLISLDGQSVSSELETKADFAVIEYLDMAVQVDNVMAYETLAIDIGDGDFSDYYRYKFTNLNQGWNIVRISKEQFTTGQEATDKSTLTWQDVERVRLTLMSRPNSIATVRFDMLGGLTQTDDLLNRLRYPRGTDYRVGLYGQYGQNHLAVRNNAPSMAVALAEPKEGRDFKLAATVRPQSGATSGLFFRGNYVNGNGYYFTIAGDLGDEWRLQRKNADGFETVLQGELDNDNFIKGEPYKLMVEVRGQTIKLFMAKSSEEQLRLLGEITDGEFSAGSVGVGVVDAGWSTFDDIQYKAF
ncbi:MAG: hypothetical protein U1C49_00330 [Candidatus Andersenbacteria bacterium]|nr:hypothetical protein [bacterium]MDZ4225271.1 hypothetical protein [Candidatus Andersenbacteria bacterium]